MLISHPITISLLGTSLPPWPTRRPDERPFTPPPALQQPAPLRRHHSTRACHRGGAKDGVPIDAVHPKRAMRARQSHRRQHTNHLISTIRHGRRTRARTAAFFASALAPAPLPSILKARDHSPCQNSCTGHLQTTAVSGRQRRGAPGWSGLWRRPRARAMSPRAQAVSSMIGMIGLSTIPADAKGQASSCGLVAHGFCKAHHCGKGE